MSSLLFFLFFFCISAPSILCVEIIAHRGAPYFLPEHSLEGYALAMRQGATYIELDLVISKDGLLICLHDVYLSEVTDVGDREEFANRSRTLEVDGVMKTDWFVVDFTKDELKTLKLRQRMATRDQIFNDYFEIPTFAEAMELVKEKNEELGIEVGLYIECMAPEFFEKHGLEYCPVLFGDLKHAGYEITGNIALQEPVLVQSTSMKFLKEEIHSHSELKIMQPIFPPNTHFDGTTIPWEQMITPEGIKEISQYAFGITVEKSYFYTFDSEFMDKITVEGAVVGKKLIEEAKLYHLHVHAWTFVDKSEEKNSSIYEDFNTPTAEYEYIYDLGVDGVFTDRIDAAFCAIEEEEEKKATFASLHVISVVIISIVVITLLSIIFGWVFHRYEKSKKGNREYRNSRSGSSEPSFLLTDTEVPLEDE